MHNLERWAAERAHLLAERAKLLKPAVSLEELSKLLSDNKEYIFGEIKAKALTNPYSSKISLMDIFDISPELKEFFRREGAYVTRAMRDLLRTWFKSYFKDRIRVEGDSYDLYLDLA